MHVFRIVFLATLLVSMVVLVIAAVRLDDLQCLIKATTIEKNCAQITNPVQCADARISFVQSGRPDDAYRCAWESGECQSAFSCAQKTGAN